MSSSKLNKERLLKQKTLTPREAAFLSGIDERKIWQDCKPPKKLNAVVYYAPGNLYFIDTESFVKNYVKC